MADNAMKITRRELEAMAIRATALRHCLKGAKNAQTMIERERWAIRAIVGHRQPDEDLFALIEEVKRLRGWLNDAQA